MSIKIENVQIFGWEGAIRGARNPMNSWEKSDSWFFNGEMPDEDGFLVLLYQNTNDEHLRDTSDFDDTFFYGGNSDCVDTSAPIMGPSDHKLLMNLCKGGTEEAKWRRMIHVQMDITAPLYWWKEFETYKVGTTSNSCSTMHKIQAKEFTLDDFSCEHLNPINLITFRSYVETTLNLNREAFLQTNDKNDWWQMIQLLPTSYNQRRTIDLNYEVLASQYRQRKEHRLDEWREYCEWIKTLPYSEFITMEENDD